MVHWVLSLQNKKGDTKKIHTYVRKESTFKMLSKCFSESVKMTNFSGHVNVFNCLNLQFWHQNKGLYLK